MVTADTEPVSVESIGWVSFQPFYGRPAYQATVEISIYLAEENRGKGLGGRILEHSIQKQVDSGSRRFSDSSLLTMHPV